MVYRVLKKERSGRMEYKASVLSMLSAVESFIARSTEQNKADGIPEVSESEGNGIGSCSR